MVLFIVLWKQSIYKYCYDANKTKNLQYYYDNGFNFEYEFVWFINYALNLIYNFPQEYHMKDLIEFLNPVKDYTENLSGHINRGISYKENLMYNLSNGLIEINIHRK